MSVRGLSDTRLAPGMPVTIYGRWHPDGVPGEIVRVGRTRVTVRRTDNSHLDAGSEYRIDGQGEIVRAGDGRWFLTDDQAAERASRDAAFAVLRDRGLGPLDWRKTGDGRADDLPTVVLVALAMILAEHTNPG